MKCFVCGKEFTKQAVFYREEDHTYDEVRAIRSPDGVEFVLCPEHMRIVWIAIACCDPDRARLFHVLPAEEESE